MNDKSIPTIGLFDVDGHITPTALEAMTKGTLCDDTLTAALEHIGSCEKCADALASSFDKSELAPVPAGFDEELQKKIIDKSKNNHSFALYVLKVAIAACIALIITFSSGFNNIITWQDKGMTIKAPGFGMVNTISSQLNSFSQSLVNMEVFNNAQKKK